LIFSLTLICIKNAPFLIPAAFIKYSSNVYTCISLSVDQYIDELEVIGTNQPQHTSKFDMMSVVQEEEESEMLDESMPERPG